MGLLNGVFVLVDAIETTQREDKGFKHRGRESSTYGIEGQHIDEI